MDYIGSKHEVVIKVTDEVILLDGKNITIGSLARFNDTSFHEMLINIGKSNKTTFI